MPSGLRLVINWQAIEPHDADAIRAFWLSEGALGDTAQATARLPQVILHVRDDADKVVGVCTAVAMTLPVLAEPMYYYRTFVTPVWRTRGAALAMLQRAQECLGNYARANAFPCIGMLVELESQQLRDLGRIPVWPRSHFVYIGKSARGLKLFAYYFAGAHLK